MSVHSKDRIAGSTKLERIGDRAKNDVETVFNNIGHVIDVGMLEVVYQQLDGNKAVGINGVTKEEYGTQLGRNLRRVVSAIRRGTYRPRPARVVEIPKEDGSTRPLAISCIEDKIVQQAVSMILGKIFEPQFLPCSYGFRPGLNCHDALKALNRHTYSFGDGAVVEIDIRKYFNTIPHAALHECLRKKISDQRFLKLIDVLIKSPLMEGDTEVENGCGCPQGSIISPILANIYLHYVIDEWFVQVRGSHLRGAAELVRYADDMVFIFQCTEDAARFYRALPKRLNKFGLEMHADKSQMISSGRAAAVRAANVRTKIPTYRFLGFTCYWGKSIKGSWRLKYTSCSDRFSEKLKGLRKFLRDHLNARNTGDIIKRVILVVKGWINYHSISDNQRRVGAFILRCERLLFNWFNRRSQKRSMNWDKFRRLLTRIGFPKSWKVTSMFPQSPKRAFK
jgi:RNA-directed DNA polymerase